MLLALELDMKLRVRFLGVTSCCVCRARPGEVIDTRDVDALTKIITVLAKNW